MSPRLALVLFLLASCQAAPSWTAVTDGAFPVPGDDPAHHRLRYGDGQITPNDSCVIKLGNRLNPKVPPLYVNGAPLGFC